MCSAAGTTFDLQFDTLSYRRRGGMVWVRAAKVPAVLEELVRTLRKRLDEAGFSVEDRPFVPHVTLLRYACKPAGWPAVELASWRVHELTLARSHPERSGTRYEVVFRVPLAQAPSST